MNARQRVRDLYREVYGDGEAAQHAMLRLEAVLDRQSRARSDVLRERDASRGAWFLSGRQVGYSCYADRFGGTLSGVAERIPHLRQLGVTYLHLLPILKTEGDENDGGFAVADYRQVDSRLGTISDLLALTEELHAHGIALCLDFIANHTSRHHFWAKRAAAGVEPYASYYHFIDEHEDVLAAERFLEDVFPQSAPGNFVYVPKRSAWVWSTFQSYQWDLNYANPMVLVEMVDTMLFLANQGVDALRVDSAPFLWKEPGTRSRDCPQTHLLLQLFRAAADLVAPSMVLLAEAIVAPRELVAYLGAHEPPVPECHIAYQGVLMPMLWVTLVTEDSSALIRVLDNRIASPAGTTWLQYVRSHDNIEWDVLSSDLLLQAGLGPDRVEEVVRFLEGRIEGSFSDGQPFEGGAGERRSTNGTTASLCGLSANDAEAGEAAVARILLLYGILFALPGFPVIFGGDELGMLNDESYAERPAESTDSRWLHRPFIDWSRLLETAPSNIFAGLQRLAHARRATEFMTAFSVRARLPQAPSSLLVLQREDCDGRRLSVVANVGRHSIQWTREQAESLGLVGQGVELLSRRPIDGHVTVAEEYSVGWYCWSIPSEP